MIRTRWREILLGVAAAAFLVSMIVGISKLGTKPEAETERKSEKPILVEVTGSVTVEGTVTVEHTGTVTMKHTGAVSVVESKRQKSTKLVKTRKTKRIKKKIVPSKPVAPAPTTWKPQPESPSAPPGRDVYTDPSGRTEIIINPPDLTITGETPSSAKDVGGINTKPN